MSSDEDNASVCQICLQGNSKGSNLIVFCEGRGCRVAVHQKCYGIGERLQEDVPWLCAACENKNRKNIPICILCKTTGGPMKPTIEGYWSHIVCALSFSEVFFDEPDKRRGISGVLTTSISQYDNETCALCNIKRGSYLKCSEKDCFTFYHPLCQNSAALPLEFSVIKRQKHSYCKVHELLCKIKTRKKKKEILKKDSPVNHLASLLALKNMYGKKYWEDIDKNYFIQDRNFFSLLDKIEKEFIRSEENYLNFPEQSEETKTKIQKENITLDNSISERFLLTFQINVDKINEILDAKNLNQLEEIKSIDKNYYLIPVLTPHKFGSTTICTQDISLLENLPETKDDINKEETSWWSVEPAFTLYPKPETKILLEKRWDYTTKDSFLPKTELSSFIQLENWDVLADKETTFQLKENNEIYMSLHRAKKQLNALNRVNKLRIDRLKSILQPFHNRSVLLKCDVYRRVGDFLNHMSFQCFGRCSKCLVPGCECSKANKEKYRINEREENIKSNKGMILKLSRSTNKQIFPNSYKKIFKKTYNKVLEKKVLEKKVLEKKVLGKKILGKKILGKKVLGKKLDIKKDWKVFFSGMFLGESELSKVIQRRFNHPNEQQSYIDQLENPQDFDNLLELRLKKKTKDEDIRGHILDILEFCKVKCVKEFDGEKQ